MKFQHYLEPEWLDDDQEDMVIFHAWEPTAGDEPTAPAPEPHKNSAPVTAEA